MNNKKHKEATAIAQELHQLNYWEHFKFESELAKGLPAIHPKRVKMHHESQKILTRIKQINENN